MNAIVIGAGLAGLACARELVEQGHRVTVIDKGRGPGGRTSTRRGEASGGPVRFDHGAQYFTARSPAFRRQVDAWLASGVAAPWAGRIIALEQGERTATDGNVTRYVGVPGMSILTRDLGTELDVRYATRATNVTRHNDAWHVTVEDGSVLGPFDALVVAVPAPQAVPLLANTQALQERVAKVIMTPCLAAMVAFPSPAKPAFDGAFVSSSPVAWAARDSSKPGRPDLLDCWVLHATPKWSLDHFDDAPADYAAALLAAFEAALGERLPSPVHLVGHRWGFARTETPIGELSLYDADARVGVCGDWCPGARVEGAFLSGQDAAARLSSSRSRSIS